MSNRDVEICRSLLPSTKDLQVEIQWINDECLQFDIHLSDVFQLEVIVPFTYLTKDDLTIDNICDIRLIQLGGSDDKWNRFNNFFYQLIQRSNCNNTLNCIVLLLREHLANLNRSQQCKNMKKHLLEIDQSVLYCFDQEMQQWKFDSFYFSPGNQSILFPKKCHIIRCNFRACQTSISEIFTELQEQLPDIICGQDISNIVLDQVFNTQWIRNNDYRLLVKLPTFKQSDGQMILIKRFQPKSYSIHHYESSAWMQLEFTFDQNEKIYLIFLYGLQCRLPDSFHEIIKQRNCLIVGNLRGDQLNKELSSMYQLDDLWKEYDDSEQDAHQFFFHRLFNLKYSIIEMKQWKKSVSQLLFQLEVRSISYSSALAIVSSEVAEVTFLLISPFFLFNHTDDDIDSILLPLRMYLSHQKSFEIRFDRTRDHDDNHQWILDEQSKDHIEKLQNDIHQLFLPFQLDVRPSDSIISSSVSTVSIRFQVRELSILQFDETNERQPPIILYRIPLGPVLRSIDENSSDRIHPDLVEFFQQMNLYPDPIFYRQKQEKFTDLLRCIDQFFMLNRIECFNYMLLPYGSHRLGLHGDDLDVVLVLTEQECTNDLTDFDRQILQQSCSPVLLKDYLMDVIQKHLQNNFFETIYSCRKISALHPLISILFIDQIKVELAIQIRFKPVTNLSSSIHGISDSEWVLVYARCSLIFQYLLTYIRRWAQQVGLYGQVNGYLGGLSWAILCAHICHEYVNNINYQYTLNDFSALVDEFFSTYSEFDWKRRSFSLRSIFHQSSDELEQYEFLNHGAISIYCPTPPYANSTRSTIRSTIELFIKALRTRSTLHSCLNQPSLFPHRKIQSLLELRLVAKDLAELDAWIGWLKSRLARFLTDCENDCELFVQTQSKIEKRDEELERFFSIGFSTSAHILSKDRRFHECLDQFFYQFRICSYRTSSMKFFYKFIPISDRFIPLKRNAKFSMCETMN